MLTVGHHTSVAMLYGQNRDEIRRVYCTAWDKHQQGLPLEPLEQQLVAIIGQHPEYHALLADHDAALTRDFTPEAGQTNPFLHMGMHLAIREQLATDRPAGITATFGVLMARVQDAHAAEHHMMDCLGEALWQAQRSGQAPDEARYLECLRQLAGG
jgi:hypothetical protein